MQKVYNKKGAIKFSQSSTVLVVVVSYNIIVGIAGI
jgi:hypothetical protein